MITSHGWIIVGAANAGLRTAYLKGNQIPYPLAPKPDYSGNTIMEIAKQLEKITQGTD